MRRSSWSWRAREGRDYRRLEHTRTAVRRLASSAINDRITAAEPLFLLRDAGKPVLFAQALPCDITQLHRDLRGRWRVALRAVRSCCPCTACPAQIAALLDYDQATVRCWIGRYNHEGITGLADRPRLGGHRLCARIATLLQRLGPWTLMRIWRYLGRPRLSPRPVPQGAPGGRVALPQSHRPRRPGPRRGRGRDHRSSVPAPGRIGI